MPNLELPILFFFRLNQGITSIVPIVLKLLLLKVLIKNSKQEKSLMLIVINRLNRKMIKQNKTLKYINYNKFKYQLKKMDSKINTKKSNAQKNIKIISVHSIQPEGNQKTSVRNNLSPNPFPKDRIRIIQRSPQPDKRFENRYQEEQQQSQIINNSQNIQFQPIVKSFNQSKESKMKQFLQHQESIMEIQLQFDCCANKLPLEDHIILKNCNHFYHQSCLFDIINKQIEKINILCRVMGCSQKIKVSQLKGLKNYNLLVERRNLFEMQFFLQAYKQFSKCPTQNCQFYFYHFKKKEQNLFCPMCYNYYCLKCFTKILPQQKHKCSVK